MSDFILLGISLGLLLGAILILLQFAYGAPYVPSHNKAVEWMISLVKGHRIQSMVDLGSGDGKIVIAFAKQGIDAHGYEINPILVFISRWRIRRLGLQDKAHIHFGNFWKKDFSQFDLVTLFAMDYMMPGVEKKVNEEMKKGDLVLSNAFECSSLQQTGKEGTVFKYIV